MQGLDAGQWRRPNDEDAARVATIEADRAE